MGEQEHAASLLGVGCEKDCVGPSSNSSHFTCHSPGRMYFEMHPVQEPAVESAAAGGSTAASSSSSSSSSSQPRGAASGRPAAAAAAGSAGAAGAAAAAHSTSAPASRSPSEFKKQVSADMGVSLSSLPLPSFLAAHPAPCYAARQILPPAAAPAATDAQPHPPTRSHPH